MPHVSVIIPNYNHSEFLKQRIDSVLNQTFDDFEIIILDDCSPDNSRAVIENYRACKKVSHIIYNENNGGTTFKQWQKGIELALGKYIWIAESDDWCENSLLETLVNEIDINENCVLAYTQSYAIDNNLNILWMSNHDKLKECIDGMTFIKTRMLVINSIVNASMAIFRKETYQFISKEFINFKFCGDWLFWIEIAKKGDVFISGLHLNYFRKHIKNVSGKAVSSGLNFIEEIKILDILKAGDIISEHEYKITILSKYYAYQYTKPDIDINMHNQIESGFYKEKEIKNYLKKNNNIKSLSNKINGRINNLIGSLFNKF